MPESQSTDLMQVNYIHIHRQEECNEDKVAKGYKPSTSKADTVLGERKPEQQFTGYPFEMLADRNLVVIESAPSSPYINGIIRLYKVNY